MNAPLLALGFALIMGLPPAAIGQPLVLQPEPAPEGAVSPTRAESPGLRCHQHGAKVVDHELPPGTTFGAEPPAGAVQLRSPDGQRVWLLPVGEGLCIVRLRAIPPPTAEASGRKITAAPTAPGPD